MGKYYHLQRQLLREFPKTIENVSIRLINLYVFIQSFTSYKFTHV